MSDERQAIEQVAPVALRWRLALAVLRRLPQGALSRVTGRLAETPIPRPLRRPLLGLFVRLTGIDMSEAALPLAEYRSVSRLFIRRLVPGARGVADGSLLVSPVDAVVGEIGTVEEGRLLQAKGRQYSAADLLDEPEQVEAYNGGSFVTLYLSPRHYHRIHSPCAGTIRRARHVPGRLLPVNLPAITSFDDLFARNERLICHLGGEMGRVAVVAVGAYNVGRISTAFDAEWNKPASPDGGVSNRRGAVASTRCYDPPVRVAAGDEIMAFHLGSTIVLLLEPGRTSLAPELAPGLDVLMGQPIARAR